MLKREFRKKYPCSPDESKQRPSDSEVNFFNCQLSDLPHIDDIRKKYCKTYGYDFNEYKKDWRSIERINPKTKKFYKSKKYS